MRPLFGGEGRRAVTGLLTHRRVLLGFDFDGTLAPIVARPDDARMPLPVARRMAALARRWPVAVITGRSVADVAARLSFEPTFVLGNHGLEVAGSEPTPHMQRSAAVIAPVRHALQREVPDLAAAGVTIEDKGYSLALHYRLATDPARARAAVDRALADLPPQVLASPGKLVVNVVAADAPDKGDGMLALVERAGAESALFVGDDLNDEPVFAKAPSHWVTVRIGRDHLLSRAAFYVDGTGQLPALLDLLQGAAGPT